MLLRVICIDESLVTGPGYLVKGQSYAVGRSSRCAFVLNDLSVSRHHADLIAGEATVFVRDRESRNGTFIDGVKVVEAEISVGQVIRFGSASFQVVANDFPEAVGNVNSAVSTFVNPIPAGETLSKTQRRVLDLLLTGLSEKEVASKLTISSHTVHNHVKEIYRKMGVNSRSELFARFVSDSKKKTLGQ